MSENDPFDLKKLVLPPEMIRVRRVTVSRRIQHDHFTKTPCFWIDQLAQARFIATYRVVLHLLYQHWKNRGRPVALANGVLRGQGVSRGAKWRALRELEQLGLISIERRLRKSPRITVHVKQSWGTGEHTHMHAGAP